MDKEFRNCFMALQKLLKTFIEFKGKKHTVLHLLTLVYMSMGLKNKPFIGSRQMEMFDKPLSWERMNENEKFHRIFNDTTQTQFIDNYVLCNVYKQLKFESFPADYLKNLVGLVKCLLDDGASRKEQIRIIVDMAINEIDAPVLPEEITQLLLNLVDYQQGHLVYDPQSGSGALISSLIKHFNDVHRLEDLNNIHAREIDPLDASISYLIAELLCNGSIKFYTNSSFDGDGRALHSSSSFDVILTYSEVKNRNNPFTEDLFPIMTRHYSRRPDYRPTKLIDHLFNSLKHDGAAAVMISELILAQSSKAELSHLIQSSIASNFLDAVLKLPSRIFNDEPHVVVVFKKFKTDRTVYFFDSSMSLNADLKLDLSDVLQGINNRETLPGRAYLAGYEEVLERGTLIVSKYLKLHSPYTTTPEEYENIEIQKKRISERSQRIKKLSQPKF